MYRDSFNKNKIRKIYNALQYIAMLVFIFAVGCKQANNDKGSVIIPPSKVTITVIGDEGVNIPPENTFTVNKGSKWKNIIGLAAKKASEKEDFEITEWHLNNATGALLDSETEFEEDKTLFVVSKRKSVWYQILHYQENIQDDNFTLEEIENKTGEAGKNTEASVKQYEGFEAQTFNQALIKYDGPTIVEIKYKRNVVSITVDLAGGETTTVLENTNDGKKLLKGKFGAKVNIEKPTKSGFRFDGWEPSLPETFPATNTTYLAKWEATTSYKVRITGDERVRVLAPQYIELPFGSQKTIGEIRSQIEAMVKIYYDPNDKDSWSPEVYGFHDWRIDGETGDEIKDDTTINGDITVYVRTNYEKFKISGTILEGHAGKGEEDEEERYKKTPRGRVFLPKEIENIANEAFKDCNKLTIVDLSLCSKLQSIGVAAFARCENLEVIDLSTCPKLNTIGGYAFNHCDKIKSVDLTGLNELTTIGPYTFSYCKNLESIDLSSCTNLQSIGDWAFLSCKKLKTVNLTGLTNITTIEDGTFYSCKNLISIDLSPCHNLKTIGLEVFYDCLNLKSVNLTGLTNLNTIRMSAFYGCHNLETIDLSPCYNLKKIEGYAFSYCTGLKSVNLTGLTNITEISGGTFAGCKNLKNVNLTGCSNINNIIDKAFAACKNLETIDLSPCSALKTLGWEIFLNCVNLKTVNLTGCSEITIIKGRTFDGCENLEDIDLSPYTNLQSIGEYSFDNCKKAEVKLPASIVKINPGAFGDAYRGSYCKKVLVPNNEVRDLVELSAYPSNRIELY